MQGEHPWGRTKVG